MNDQAADIVVNLDLPARFPSRYRGRLVTVTRLEARVRFPFAPSVFRAGEVGICDAEILLVLGRQAVRLGGSLEPDRSGTQCKVRFDEPMGLHDYALLRRACGLDDPPKDAAAEAASGASPEAEDLVSVGGRGS